MKSTSPSMLIGICSDSHSRADAVRNAVAIFDREGAERIIHCGDVGGREVFDALSGHIVHYVWGNTDSPDESLVSYAQGLGFSSPGTPPLRIELAGKKIAVFHGHEREFHNAPSALGVDYILCGHSHVRKDERIGGVRRINPGALFRVTTKTVATLDLVADRLTYFEVD